MDMSAFSGRAHRISRGNTVVFTDLIQKCLSNPDVSISDSPPHLGHPGVFPTIDKDVRVIAWGLSLERPTMIKYGITNIRELFGHKADLNRTKTAPVCRFD